MGQSIAEFMGFGSGSNLFNAEGLKMRRMIGGMSDEHLLRLHEYLSKAIKERGLDAAGKDAKYEQALSREWGNRQRLGKALLEVMGEDKCYIKVWERDGDKRVYVSWRKGGESCLDYYHTGTSRWKPGSIDRYPIPADIKARMTDSQWDERLRAVLGEIVSTCVGEWEAERAKPQAK